MMNSEKKKNVEIERKFLLAGNQWKVGATGNIYRQGYLAREQGCTVRVRVSGTTAFITIKGPTRGIARQEFEYSIPVTDAEDLLALCKVPLIEKTRYIVDYRGRHWEIDEFHGDNQGLIIAEIELADENDPLDLPPWIGQEVSHDPRYFNANLVVHPFSSW
jgi:adenylate cyclase